MKLHKINRIEIKTLIIPPSTLTYVSVGSYKITANNSENHRSFPFTQQTGVRNKFT